MSIIDSLKESADSHTVARFENLARAGRLSEAQVRYGKDIIRKAREAAKTDEDRAREAEAARVQARLAQAKRNAPRKPRAAVAVAEFHVGQSVTCGGKRGTVVEVKGTGKNAVLAVDVDGATCNFIARYATAN